MQGALADLIQQGFDRARVWFVGFLSEDHFMKLILNAMMLGALLMPGVAHAQSWQFSGDRATAPRSVAGDPTSGFEIVCFQGEWSLYLFTAVSPSGGGGDGSGGGGGGAATIIVDGQRFPTRFDMRPPMGDEGMIVTPAIIDALKAGSRVEITFPTGGTPYSASFGLRGSSRALSAVDSGCAVPTPATHPERFKSPAMGSTTEAITLASELLRPILTDAQRIDANVGIGGANIVDLGNGWQFLIVDIGPSTSLYGVAAFETVLAAKPPAKEWQIVAQQVGVAAYVDSQAMTNGYPDIWYQSVRGVNQPYALWQWTGSEYAFRRRVPN